MTDELHRRGPRRIRFKGFSSTNDFIAASEHDRPSRVKHTISKILGISETSDRRAIRRTDSSNNVRS